MSRFGKSKSGFNGQFVAPPFSPFHAKISNSPTVPLGPLFGVHVKMAETKGAQCPLCAVMIDLPASPEVGELLDCPECGEELEILALEPPKLVKAPEEEEDWGE